MINRRFIYFSIFIIFISVSYFLFSPVFIHGIKNIFYFEFVSLDDARSYYTVLSSISSTIVAWTGIFIGYFYYENRKNHDRKILEKDKIEKRVSRIYALLSDIGECVEDILCIRFNGRDQLELLRSRLLNKFDDVILIVENNEILLDLSNEEIRPIVEIYSFVEQSEMIMLFNREELRNTTDRSEVLSRFQMLFRDAKEICLLNCAP